MYSPHIRENEERLLARTSPAQYQSRFKLLPPAVQLWQVLKIICDLLFVDSIFFHGSCHVRRSFRNVGADIDQKTPTPFFPSGRWSRSYAPHRPCPCFIKKPDFPLMLWPWLCGLVNFSGLSLRMKRRVQSKFRVHPWRVSKFILIGP